MTVHGQRDTEQLLGAYFADLGAALANVPRARRQQLIDDIRQHIDQGLAVLQPTSSSEVQDLLNRVGRPEEIAAAALDEDLGPALPRSGRRFGHWALGAVVVVVVGGLVAALVFVLVSSPTPPHGSSVAHPRSSATTAPTTTTTAPAPTTTSTAPAPTTTTFTPPATSPSDPLAVLSPATVAPESDECIRQLTYDADGNVTPLLCPGGGVNVLAWQHYAQGSVHPRPITDSQVMQLGRYATPTQVYQAMCADYQNRFGTDPLTDSAEALAAAYYGWRFAGGTPAREFDIKGCPPT